MTLTKATLVFEYRTDRKQEQQFGRILLHMLNDIVRYLIR